MEKFTDIYFGVSGAAEVFIGYHYFGRLAGKNAFGKCAAALTVLTVMQLCFGAVNSVIVIASGFIIGRDPDFTAVLMIFLNMLSLFISCICCEIIIKKTVAERSDKIQNTAEFFLPFMMIFTLGIYINRIFYGDTVSEKTLGVIFCQSPIMLILIVLGLIAVFCIIRLQSKFILKNTEAKCAELRAENAERLCENTRAFRHDVKSHMLAMSGFLSKGDVNGAEIYLAETEKIFAETSERFKTGNPLADIILNRKLSEAEKIGVKISCDIKIPRRGVSDTDLCIILANAVDNAVHACERLDVNTERFIEIRGGIQGNILLIEIKNSFDGEKFKKSIGLKNIEAAAEQYCGNVKIFCSKNAFTLRIIMNITAEKNYISQH